MRPALSSLAFALAVLSAASSSGVHASPGSALRGGAGSARFAALATPVRHGPALVSSGRITRGLAAHGRRDGTAFLGPDGRSHIGIEGRNRRFSRYGGGYGYGWGYPFAMVLGCDGACSGPPDAVELVTSEPLSRPSSVGIRPSPVEPPAIYVIGNGRSPARVRASMRRRSVDGVSPARLEARGAVAPHIIQVTAGR